MYIPTNRKFVDVNSPLLCTQHSLHHSSSSSSACRDSSNSRQDCRCWGSNVRVSARRGENNLDCWSVISRCFSVEPRCGRYVAPRARGSKCRRNLVRRVFNTLVMNSESETTRRTDADTETALRWWAVDTKRRVCGGVWERRASNLPVVDELSDQRQERRDTRPQRLDYAGWCGRYNDEMTTQCGRASECDDEMTSRCRQLLDPASYSQRLRCVLLLQSVEGVCDESRICRHVVRLSCLVLVDGPSDACQFYMARRY